MADYSGFLSGIFGLGSTLINNAWADDRTRTDRASNYKYGEMAAENADKRTRALYADFYSPEALMRQYGAAGLSPSMMFGGTPGQGGMSGAQGSGAAGPQTPFMPISMVDAAQATALFAQAKKSNAEAANINKDTDLKQLEEQYNQFRNNEKNIEYQLSTLQLTDMNGEVTSLYEIATECRDYDQFMNELKKDWGLAQDQKLLMSSEVGQKTLRDIYYNANRMSRDIAVLSSEEVDAKFQENLLQALSKKGFAEQNAETCIAQLEAAAEMANLTKTQKESFNNVIAQLKKKNSTVADILIVISMILGNFMSGSVSVSKKL